MIELHYIIYKFWIPYEGLIRKYLKLFEINITLLNAIGLPDQKNLALNLSFVKE